MERPLDSAEPIEPSKLEKIKGWLPIAGFSAASIAATLAITYNGLKEIRDTEEKAKKEAEIRERLKNFDPQRDHGNLLRAGKDIHVIHKVEWQNSVPIPEGKYTLDKFEKDKKEFEDLLELTKNKKLNIDTSSMNQPEIDKLYGEITQTINHAIENRHKLLSLNFHQHNDPRVLGVLKKAATIMNVSGAQKNKLATEGASIYLSDVSVEAVPGQDAGAMTYKDQMRFPSQTLIQILDSKDPQHLEGIAALSNEACHYFRYGQYLSDNAYDNAYKEAVKNHTYPKDFVGKEKLPEEAVKFYDDWYTKYYSPVVGTCRELEEKESFYVSYLTTTSSLQEGITINLDGAASEKIGWQQEK